MPGIDFKDVFKDPEDRELAEFRDVDWSAQWGAQKSDVKADFEAAKKMTRDLPAHRPIPELFECENCACRFFGVLGGEGGILCHRCLRHHERCHEIAWYVGTWSGEQHDRTKDPRDLMPRPEFRIVLSPKLREYFEQEMKKRGAQTPGELMRMCWDELTDDQKEGIMEELWRSPYENAF